MVSLPYDKVTPLLNEDETNALLADITSAGAALARSTTVPTEIRDLVRALPDRLHADAPSNALAGDPYLADNAFAGAARAAAALLDPDPSSARRVLRLALEQVRQALRDIIDARPADEDMPAAAIATWLEETLGVPQQSLAELLGTTPRTWQRWLHGTQPDPDALIRLRRVAGLTVHLRHALTGPGVVRWFTRSQPNIKGGDGRPVDLLADPSGYQALLVLASGLRSTQAS